MNGPANSIPKNRLWQIVPRINPSQDGVGDFALALARQLRSEHEILSEFLCGDLTWTGPGEIDGFRVHCLGSGREARMVELLVQDPTVPVLVNYVPPGYDRNSCPFWLVRALKRWRAAHPHSRLVTVFHELYSEGPPWTRAFWTGPGQRHVARQLAGISDVVQTSVEIVRARLERMAPRHGGRVTCLPVFSNVGEGDALGAAAREPWVAVFGSAGWRRKAYEDHRSSLERACALFGITRVIDVGMPLGSLPCLAVPVEQTGRLEVDEVEAWLGRCRYGFVTYPELWLGKSGIFAAYCAHGCIPLLPPESRAAEGAGTDAPVIVIADAVENIDLAAAQQRVRSWYQPHAVAGWARIIFEQLRTNAPVV